MRDYHVLIGKESTFGTYAAGTNAFPADSVSIDSGAERIQGRHTGSGRSLRYDWRGAVNPSASIEMPFWSEYMGMWLNAALFNDVTTTTPATPVGALARLHGFLADDSAASEGISMEVQHTASVAQFLKGCLVNSLSITIARNNLIMISAEIIGLDIVRAAGTWLDGVAAPSVTATPSYFATTIRPHTTFETVVKLGGTVALNATDGRLEVSTGVVSTAFESITIDINNNIEPIHTLQESYGAANLHVGQREITVDFEIDWETPVNTWWDLLFSNSTTVLEVLATGDDIDPAVNSYEFGIVVPALSIQSAPYPDANGNIDHSVQSISALAVEHSTGYDISFHIQDNQTSY